MIQIIQREVDYRWKKRKCKIHNPKHIATEEGQVIGKICRQCGAELLASNPNKVVGVSTKCFGGGVIIHGAVKIKVGK